MRCPSQRRRQRRSSAHRAEDRHARHGHPTDDSECSPDTTASSWKPALRPQPPVFLFAEIKGTPRFRQLGSGLTTSIGAALRTGQLSKSDDVKAELAKMRVERKGGPKAQSPHDREARRVGIAVRLIRLSRDEWTVPAFRPQSSRARRPNFVTRANAGRDARRGVPTEGHATRRRESWLERDRSGAFEGPSMAVAPLVIRVISIEQRKDRACVYEDLRHLARSPAARCRS